MPSAPMVLSSAAVAAIAKKDAQIKASKRSKVGFNKKITKVPLGLADVYRTRLRYTDINDSVDGAAPTYYKSAKFSMTNLQDPDITGTGARCPLMSNLTAIYDRWIVNSCTVTCHIANYATNPVCVMLLGLFDPSSNTPTVPENPSTYDLAAISPSQRSARKRLNALGQNVGTTCVLKKKFYPKDFIDDYHSSVNFSGIGSNAPANYATVALIVQSGNSAVSSHIGNWLQWQVEYDVTFSERKLTEVAAFD